MQVRFEMRTPPNEPGRDETLPPVEYIFLAVPNSKDEVARIATDADKAVYYEQYSAFKGTSKTEVAAPKQEVLPDMPPAPEAPPVAVTEETPAVGYKKARGR